MAPPQAAAPFQPVIVAPSYNNARTLADVLTRAAAHGLPIILVNDGCTDDTPSVIESWQRTRSGPPLETVTHARNRGKAAALLSGFAAATERGFTHAVTIDTDGQHDPERISDLLRAAAADPAAYIIGVRDDHHPDYPAASRLGRRLSNLFIRLECGVRVRDSQCGMRVYPLAMLRAIRCGAGYFGFEAESITRAVWAGWRVVEVPINTCYLPPGEQVSHFRPWVDTLRGIAMHAGLLFRAVLPLPRHPLIGSPCLAGQQSEGLGRRLSDWINPLRAWRELRQGHMAPGEMAAALATGVFVANLPVYPFQTVLSLYLARRLHLNPLAVVAGSQVSTPPVGPVLIAAAVCIGHFLLHGTFVWSDFRNHRAGWGRIAGPLVLDWIVGGVLLGFILAAICFVLATFILRARRDAREARTREVAPET